MNPRRGSLALAAALVVLAALAMPAAGAPTKYYSSSISPACVGASSVTSFALTLKNENPPGGQSFGSANVAIDPVFTSVSSTMSITFVPASTTKSWTATLNGSIIELRSGRTSSNGIFPGESVVVHFTATTPSSDGAYPWAIQVKQSNDFRGTNNDFSLPPNTSPATTYVGGACNPSAANDSYSTNEDTTLNVAAPGVLGNDTDPPHTGLTAVLVTGPTNASSFTLNADGSFTYVPAANFHGSDSFTYKANNGTDSNVATVSITVNSVNDAPVATAQSVSTNEDTALAITLAGTDADGDPLSFKVTSLPANGDLYNGSDTSGHHVVSADLPYTLSGSAVTYDPSANYNGSDGFNFKVNDGTVDSAAATVSITVSSVNDAPVANADSYSMLQSAGSLTVNAPGVLGNDTDADGNALTAVLVSGPSDGTLTLNADGSFTYTPASGFAGADSFTYKANDGTADSNVATVKIYVATGILDCGANNTADAIGLGDLADVHISRLENTDPNSTCVAKNYALTTKVEDPPGPDGPTNVVTFDQQTVSGQESAHYLMTITWTYPPGTSTNTNPSTIGGRTFQIDYGDGTGPHDAELCDSVTYDGQGNVTGATHPTGVPWCITGQSYTINSAGKIVLIQSWDGLGDPKVW